MMDGFRMDDLIAGNWEGTLTEDEIVDYVHCVQQLVQFCNNAAF